jgi:hypothetical protein
VTLTLVQTIGAAGELDLPAAVDAFEEARQRSRRAA